MVYIFVILFSFADEQGQGHHDLGIFGEGKATGIFYDLEDCLDHKEKIENHLFGMILDNSGQVTIEMNCEPYTGEL